MKLARALQEDIKSEKAMTTALLVRVKALETSCASSKASETKARKDFADLEETVADLMASLEMRDKLKEVENGEGLGGDLVVRGKHKGREAKRK